MKNSLFVYLIAGLAFVCLAADLPLRDFRPPSIPFITQSPEVQNHIRDDVATGKEGVAWWDGAQRGMVGMIRVDGVLYRWLGVYDEEANASSHVVQFKETDVCPGDHDIANSKIDNFDDCNRFCSRYTNCRSFVLDQNLGICYLKDTVEPRMPVAHHLVGIVVPDADKFTGTDIAPGQCDVDSKVVKSESECAEFCAENMACTSYIIRGSDNMCYLKSCNEPKMPVVDHTAYIPKELHPTPRDQPPAAKQLSVVVYPTRTVFEFEAGTVKFTVTSLASMFTDDFDLTSRPTTTVNVKVSSLDAKSHDVQIYFEAEAVHTVSSAGETVEWKDCDGFAGVKIGSKDQAYFRTYGDHVGMDWGYLILAADTNKDVKNAWRTVGKAADVHNSFAKDGSLPRTVPGSGRAFDGPIVAAVSVNLGSIPTSGSAYANFVYGYDDVYSVYYFGDKLRPFWTQKYSNIEQIVLQTFKDYDMVLKKSIEFDTKLLNDVSKKAGDKMATLAAIAYRQTLAAIKPVWNEREGTSELYLREISTNSDLNTVDVVFPASPLFLYFNHELLWKLLNPVLRYGNNETWIKYHSPYSPHQLGVYPVGNDTTEKQEQMPTENTGNMFLMLLAILQRNGGDTSFYYPRYFPLLKSWADYLLSRLPFIQNELCTDDFLGAIANNTNLAAKGIIALEAFSQLCSAATHDSSCKRYSDEASRLAKMWVKYGMVQDPMPHVAMCFGQKKTWSTKYNMLWQKILKFQDKPFSNFEDLVTLEEKYYISIAQKYGFPVDARTNWAKLDWIAWAAALSYDEGTYNTIVDMFYRAMNDMSTRCPMTDLYNVDSSTAVWCGSFIARPVVGGLFAKMLV